LVARDVQREATGIRSA